MFSRIILLFLLALSNFAWGTNDLAIIDDTNKAFNLGLSGEYFIDETANLTIKEVSNERYDNRFRPLNKEFLQFGQVKGNIWIRSDIAIRATTRTPILLEVKSHRLQYLDAYFPQINNLARLARLGEETAQNQRLIQRPHYLYAVPPNPPAVFTVYLKLASQLPINAEISVRTMTSIDSEEHSNFLISGFLIGILTLLLVNNVLFYAKSRHPMYLYYGLLLISVAFFHLSLHGLLADLSNEPGFQERIYNLASFVGTSAIVFFSRLYLNTKTHFPNLDKILKVWGAIVLVLAGIFTLQPSFFDIKVLSVVGFTTLISLSIHAIVAVVKGIPFAGFYLFARLILLIGHFSWLTTVYGILDNPTILYWGLTLACIGEALVHYLGMLIQKDPLRRSDSRDSDSSRSHTFELLVDLSSRLRRQTNIIDGSLSWGAQTYQSSEAKQILAAGTVANNHIKGLIERIDLVNSISEQEVEKNTPSILLKTLINNAYNQFQEMDQDNASIELNLKKLEQVEILRQGPLVQHLVEVALMELKHFTDQVLTVDVSLQFLERKGLTHLEMSFFPLPTRIQNKTRGSDLGIKYIELITSHLQGGIEIIPRGQHQELKVSFPIQSHKRQIAAKSAPITSFNILVFGQDDRELQRALAVLQYQQNVIEQLTTLDDLLNYLATPKMRTRGTVIIVFDNGGHIPHISQQKVRPLMRLEDQSILITDNAKISRDYAKKLGYDDLLLFSEIEDQLEPRLNALISKGDKLKRANLSRINSLQQIVP